MKIIRDVDVLAEIFNIFNDRYFIYNNKNNNLIFESNTHGGGERENETFYLKFIELSIFHIPINFDFLYIKKSYFSSTPITSFKVCDAIKCKELLPNSNKIKYSILTDNTICVRFYACNEPTECYIICNKIEGWIESLNNHITEKKLSCPTLRGVEYALFYKSTKK